MTQRARTKIVCTLGPSTNSTGTISELIGAGMDVARLNFSHGSHDDHLTLIRNLRSASEQTGEQIAILQDLQGPKMRVGTIKGDSVRLESGRQVTLTTRTVDGDEAIVPVSYQGLAEDAKAGDKILLDDGRISLHVLEVRPPDVRCEIVAGGELSSHKGVNLPGVAVTAPSLTGKDLEDLEFGIRNEVDYVALSFVRSASDVRSLRTAIRERIPKGRYLPVIAKIEKPEAVTHIDSIIAEADGIMIARGDLGVELSPEDVPLVQKRIIRKCNAAGKPVVIATQMLESMTASPTPTRAETSDVANAVLDGGDAVMLSGETSVGRYPLESVRMMNRIICKVESGQGHQQRILDRPMPGVEDQREALGRAACVLAEQMGAAGIVTVTHTGKNARIVARYRPRPGIIAVTDRPKVVRRLRLIWGVRSIVVDRREEDSDTMAGRVKEGILKSALVRQGESVVLLAGHPLFAKGSTSFIRVEKI